MISLNVGCVWEELENPRSVWVCTKLSFSYKKLTFITIGAVFHSTWHHTHTRTGTLGTGTLGALGTGTFNLALGALGTGSFNLALGTGTLGAGTL